jgi:RNA polymerase sigma factor (sigma-70 family)
MEPHRLAPLLLRAVGTATTGNSNCRQSADLIVADQVLLELAARGARERVLEAALSGLTTREREVFALLQLKTREIASTLGVAEATVRVLKARVLKKFSMA